MIRLIYITGAIDSEDDIVTQLSLAENIADAFGVWYPAATIITAGSEAVADILHMLPETTAVYCIIYGYVDDILITDACPVICVSNPNEIIDANESVTYYKIGTRLDHRLQDHIFGFEMLDNASIILRLDEVVCKKRLQTMN
jgi:hypothetical protein